MTPIVKYFNLKFTEWQCLLYFYENVQNRDTLCIIWCKYVLSYILRLKSIFTKFKFMCVLVKRTMNLCTHFCIKSNQLNSTVYSNFGVFYAWTYYQMNLAYRLFNISWDVTSHRGESWERFKRRVATQNTDYIQNVHSHRSQW